MAVNLMLPLDLDWLKNVRVNESAASERLAFLSKWRQVNNSSDRLADWLLRAVTCIDLTTLCGDDTAGNVHKLCHKACNPVEPKILQNLGFKGRLTVGAVCVYPARVADCVVALGLYNSEPTVGIASVAAGFPSGQFGLQSRLAEIRYAVADGATEIDIVINRGLALVNDWKGVYDELVEMREACAGVRMKSIIAAGELGSLANVYKASLVAMMAGSDFIKTSTGKETVNATLSIGLVMVRAIRQYHIRTGRKVGFKPAGGIRTHRDAVNWLVLIKEELGDDWLHPNLFRIGASGLLADIEKQLFVMAFQRQPERGELASA